MNKKQNKIFIISGPSGVGKTTIAKRVIKKLPQLKTSLSFTTRNKRLGKKEDKTFVHVSEDEFRAKIEQGNFLEWAVVHDNLYGTDKATVEKTLKNHNMLMNIDPQGALQIKNKMPAQTVLIFLKTNTIAELARRILKREKMPKAVLDIRLNKSAKKELSLAKQYDYIVVNEKNKVPQTVDKVVNIINSYLNS